MCFREPQLCGEGFFLRIGCSWKWFGVWSRDSCTERTMVALLCMDQSVGLGSLASRCCRAELQTFKAGEASTSVTVARSLQNGSSRPSFVPRKQQQQQQQPPPALLLQQRLTVFAEQKEALSGVEERTGSRLGFEDRENSDRHSMNFAAVSVDDPTPAAATASSNATVAVTNLGNNMRKMEATIAIQAPLEAVWGVLTDYEHLADHIPGLAESQILERWPSGARLLQIGQKNLALGVKFKAKAVVEVSEEAAQELPNGTLRDLHFKTVEGDFQVFKGTWRMHQVHSDRSSKSPSAEKNVETHLSYILEVQPKHWIPVALIEDKRRQLYLTSEEDLTKVVVGMLKSDNTNSSGEGNLKMQHSLSNI